MSVAYPPKKLRHRDGVSEDAFVSIALKTRFLDYTRNDKMGIHSKQKLRGIMQAKVLSKLSQRDYKPLGEVVFENLRDAILTGKLAPGARLMEIQLAETLGVSRTPVREAMKRLEQEDFIEVIPRKGAYVKELNIKDILDVLELRRLLEGFAAQYAAENMTDGDIEAMQKLLRDFEKAVAAGDTKALIENDYKYHDTIYGVSQNAKLKETIKNLQEQFYRFRAIYFNEYSDYQQIVDGHRQILSALEARDAARAKQIVQAHIDVVIQSVKGWGDSQKRRR